MQMDVHNTLCPFYPLVCAGWTSILNLLSEMFFTLRLPEMLFLFFIDCLISIFFEHFLEVSHNLRKINAQNNMRGEKTKNLDTPAKLFQAIRSRTTVLYMLTRLSHNWLKLEHHAGLKNWADEYRKLATANVALYWVLTKKSELNLNDKDVFSQVWKDVF